MREKSIIAWLAIRDAQRNAQQPDTLAFWAFACSGGRAKRHFCPKSAQKKSEKPYAIRLTR
jgi:hypothetical protein